VREITVIIVFSLVLLVSEYCGAGQVVDFGAEAPVEEVTARREISLTLASETASLELRLAADSLQTAANQQLGQKRVELETKTERLVLSSTPIRVNKDDFLSTQELFILPLLVTVVPADQPGNYQGQLFITQLDSDGAVVGLTAEKKLAVTINSWLRIKQISGREVIQAVEADYKQETVFNRGEPLLQVAANTDWQLYGFLAPDSCLPKQGIKLQVTADSDCYTVLDEQGLYLASSPRQILVGEKTTNQENYWVEIPLKLIIERFTKLKAGSLQFPVHFAVAYRE